MPLPRNDFGASITLFRTCGHQCSRNGEASRSRAIRVDEAKSTEINEMSGRASPQRLDALLGVVLQAADAALKVALWHLPHAFRQGTALG